MQQILGFTPLDDAPSLMACELNMCIWIGMHIGIFIDVLHNNSNVVALISKFHYDEMLKHL